MRILITGIPGWLGGRFLEILVKGFDDNGPILRDWRIRCLVLPGEKTSFIDNLNREGGYPYPIEIARADVTQKSTLKDAVKDVETIFHIVGIIHPKKIKDLYRINAQGTLNLVSEAMDAKVKRFIHISSNSVAGTNPHRHILMKEEDAPNPYIELRGQQVLCRMYE